MEDSAPRALPPRSAELVEQGDLDLLTWHVDDLVASEAWEELVALRTHCRMALERGKQLWPVATYIEYRLCLDAPGPWAAQALEGSTGRFSLGPLPEVAASTHAWEELAPHLHLTPQAALVAHERVLRGEDLSGDSLAVAMPEVLDVPLRLAAWEPSYVLAEYEADKMAAPSPRLVPLRTIDLQRPGGTRRPPANASGSQVGGPKDEVRTALEELVVAWTTESDARAETSVASGPVLAAVAAFGSGPVELTELPAEGALCLMGWAGASGGAHGRRRGAAPGRFGAWGVLAALAGVREDWRANEPALAAVASATRWYSWEDGGPSCGWSLRLALEVRTGPYRGRSFALRVLDCS
jgi:hypothetical protein